METKFNWESFNKAGPKKSRKKKQKDEGPKEKPIEQQITERAIQQIIARADKQSNAILQMEEAKILEQLGKQAQWNLDENYKLYFTGRSYIKIFPDGSKEITIPPAVRGKIFAKYKDLFSSVDYLDELGDY